MSYQNRGNLFRRLSRVRSVKSLAMNFLLPTMAGQKLFLYNERLPRVINTSFIEKTCMYSCRMCPYSDTDVRKHYREEARMSMETLKNLVRSIPNDPFHSFDMSAVGETLEFEEIAEFVAYIKRTKPLVNTIISTNGVLLNEKMFLALAEAGLDNLQVSLFAENADDHQFVTGTSSFERVKENLEAITRLKKSMKLTKPFIQTFILEYEEVQKQIDSFIDRWDGKVDKAFVRPLLKRAMTIEGMTPLYDFSPTCKRRPCMQPWYSTTIDSKGNVKPCYTYHWHSEAWDFSFGNVNDAPLTEIWKSPEFVEFRRKHLAMEFDDLPVCQRCIAWNDYTDVWKENGNGEYAYSPVKLRDFFTRVSESRGG